jgi:hypothetical protein
MTGTAMTHDRREAAGDPAFDAATARRMNPLGTRAGERYRLVPRAAIVPHLAIHLGPPTPEIDAAADAALARLERAGLPAAQGPRGPEFDPFEVINFSKALPDRVFLEHMVPCSRARVETFRAALEARAAGAGAGARFSIVIGRRFHFGDRAVGDKVRLSIPLPLDDEHRQTEAIEVHAPPSLRVQHSAGWVELRGVVPPDRRIDAEVRLGVVLDCQAAPRTAAELSPDERAAWLAFEEEDLVRVTPRVRALAERVASQGAPLERVHALWDELSARVVPGFVHREDHASDRPLDDLLALGWGDCRTTAAVLTASCRVLGIPARIISGAFLYDDVTIDNHFWVEAWIDGTGWLPFDLSGTQSLFARDDGDAPWRDHFFGRVDYRLVFARHPRRAFAPVGVAVPADWYRAEHRSDGGLWVDYFQRADGRPLYSTFLAVSERAALDRPVVELERLR